MNEQQQQHSLFERLVAECGLSALFAKSSMTRALRRAGVDAERLTQRDLQRALPEIRQAITPFLEARADDAMRRIERLAGK